MMAMHGCSFIAAYRRADGSSLSAWSKGRQPSGAVLHSSRESVVRRPCSDLMDMLRRLINCRIIIIICSFHRVASVFTLPGAESSVYTVRSTIKTHRKSLVGSESLLHGAAVRDRSLVLRADCMQPLSMCCCRWS